MKLVWLMGIIVIVNFVCCCQNLIIDIDICLFHNNFKINMFFLICILNIGHVTSMHITYSSREINKHFFLGFGFKEKGKGGGESIK